MTEPQHRRKFDGPTYRSIASILGAVSLAICGYAGRTLVENLSATDKLDAQQTRDIAVLQSQIIDLSVALRNINDNLIKIIEIEREHAK